MEHINIIIALVVFLLLIAGAVAVGRVMHAKQLREAEQRRPVDQGKHVEL